MHEIEALTEASIRLLDRTEGLDHRSMTQDGSKAPMAEGPVLAQG
jgi:hypothetical protein